MVLIAFSVVYLIRGICCLWVYYKHEGYRNLPSSANLKQYYHDYFDYQVLKGQPEEIAARKTRDEFYSYLQDLYIEAADLNFFINERKNVWLVRNKVSNYLALFFLALSLVPFFVVYFSKSPQLFKVKIVNSEVAVEPSLKNEIMNRQGISERNTEVRKGQFPNNQPGSSAAVQHLPPKRPALRIIKEGKFTNDTRKQK